MKKEGLLILGLIGLAGVVMFADQVLAYFAGMSPLEAVKQIFTFVLHVTVGTVCAYVVFGLPAIVKPWVKMLKRSSRRWKSGPRANWRRETTVPAQPRMRMPKLTAELRLPRTSPTRRDYAVPSPNERASFGEGQGQDQNINIRF